MSTSDLYIVNLRSTRHVAEFRNGWGSAPIAWDHLSSKYIPERPVYLLEGGYLKKVWALVDDERLAFHERVALLMTFDRAMVPIPHLDAAGDACVAFGRECENGRSVNHWPAIGDALKSLATKSHHRAARGVALSCTSVSDPWGWPSPEQLARAWPIFKEPALTQPTGGQDHE